MKDYVTTLQDNLSFVNREQHNMTFSDNYFIYSVEAAMYQDTLDRLQDTIDVAFQLAGEILRLEELLKEETLWNIN